MPGKGKGGTMKTLGNTNSFNECVTLVQKSDPTANGVSWSAARTGSCVGEIAQVEVEISAGDDWVNCYIVPRPAGQLIFRKYNKLVSRSHDIMR